MEFKETISAGWRYAAVLFILVICVVCGILAPFDPLLQKADALF